MTTRKLCDSISTQGTFTTAELRAVLEGKPDNAKVNIETFRGDPRDPREAGYKKTVITVEWEVEI